MSARKKTTLGVVHVTATKLKFPLTDEELEKMHRARGFNGVGYNEWIDVKGVLHTGRGVDQIGAHVRGYNSVSYGIALEGGYDGFDANELQMKALEKRMREITQLYPQIKWCGHRDLSPDGDGDGVIEPHEHTKACPQFDVIPWAKGLGLPVADIRGVWDKQAAPDGRNAWLQRLLMGRGYPVGVIDGIVGPDTRNAIKLFQSDHGLKQTGAFNAETVDKLRELSEEATKVAVVPKQLDKPMVKTSGFVERAGMLLLGSGGLGTTLFTDYRTTAIFFGAMIILALVGLFFHQRIVKAVRSIRDEVEQL